MNRKRLWAPWRVKYVRNKKNKQCIFCRAKRSPDKNYVIFKTKHSLCLLNLFPYNNGHMLIAPLRHVKELSQLKDAEILDFFRALNQVKLLLDKTLRPEGYNIGLNLTEHAGAGIPGHLHLHIVPRWKGDTNFMPVVYGTKVISQSLDELTRLLKKNYAKTTVH